MVGDHGREESTLSGSTTQSNTVYSIDEQKYKGSSSDLSTASTIQSSTLCSIDEQKCKDTHLDLPKSESSSEHKFKGSHTDLSTTESASEDSTEREAEYPEGGLKAWLVVFGSWCALFAALGIMNTMGSYEAYISTHQLKSYSTGDVGWIFSMYAFLTFGGGIVVGPAFDKYGPRYLILSGGIGVSVSMLLLGNCQVYWHFMAIFGVLGGLGSALIFSPSLAIIRHYFMKRQGIATGIAATGGAVGGILFPFMLQCLLPHYGFNWCTKFVAAVTVLLCGLANLFIKPRLPPGGTIWPDHRIFRDATFSITVTGVFLLELALFIPLTYISSFVSFSGFSSSSSYMILMLINLGSVFGRGLPGYFADKMGHYNAAILAILLTVISVLAIWLPAGNSKAGLIVFALLFGFGSGSNISLTPVCISQLCPVEKIGRYIATCYAAVSVGCLIGVPIAGEILDIKSRASGYRNLILFVGCCYFGGLVAFLIARIRIKGFRIQERF